MAHDVVYGICENKCFVEVSPKTDVEQAQETADSKVSKSGDMMSGNLILVNESGNANLLFNNSSGNIVNIQCERDKGTLIFNNPTGSTYFFNSNGSLFGVTPSSATDSSTKIATTEWVNKIDNDVVHKSRAETISGAKTLTAEPVIAFDGCKLVLKNTEYVMGGDLKSYYTHNIAFVDKNNVYGGAIQKRVDANGDSYITIETQNNAKTATSTLRIYAKNDGTKYVTAPTTPSSATSNEIATANWVNNKLASVGSEWTQVTAEPTSSAPLSGVVSISGDVVTFLKDVRIDVYNYYATNIFGSVVINKGTKMDKDSVTLTPATIGLYTMGCISITQVVVDFNDSGLYIRSTARVAFDFKTSSYTNAGALTFTTGTLNASTPGYSIYTRG